MCFKSVFYYLRQISCLPVPVPTSPKRPGGGGWHAVPCQAPRVSGRSYLCNVRGSKCVPRCATCPQSPNCTRSSSHHPLPPRQTLLFAVLSALSTSPILFSLPCLRFLSITLGVLNISFFVWGCWHDFDCMSCLAGSQEVAPPVAPTEPQVCSIRVAKE